MKSNKMWIVVLLAVSALMIGLIAIEPSTRSAVAATPNSGSVNAMAGTGGVTAGLIVKLEAAGKIIPASAATDKTVGICEVTALVNVGTRYAPAGTITTVTSGGQIAVGDLLTSDAAGKAVAVSTASASNNRVIAIALTAAGGANVSVTCVVTHGYVNALPTFYSGVNAVGADTLAIPVTKAAVSKTTGADAEALTLANGVPSQVLVITLAVDGGGDGTLTPTTKTGFATIVFADAGDTVSLLYVDDTVGWVILGLSGLTANPVVTL